MMLCGAVIWLDKDHHSNTYCMREQGHAGEHSVLSDKELAAPLTERKEGAK